MYYIQVTKMYVSYLFSTLDQLFKHTKTDENIDSKKFADHCSFDFNLGHLSFFRSTSIQQYH